MKTAKVISHLPVQKKLQITENTSNTRTCLTHQIMKRVLAHLLSMEWLALFFTDWFASLWN
jgi:hypothetical protein